MAQFSIALKLRDLEPEIEELRQALFGTTDPPFSTYKRAFDWLEKEFEAGKPDPSSTVADTFMEELQELEEKWRPVLGYPMRVQPERLGLMVRDPQTGRAYKKPYWNRSKIPSLHRFVESASRRTGFSEPLLLGYVLSGEPPFLGPITIANSRFFNGRSPELMIKIRKPDICLEDVRQAYDMIKEQLKRKRPSLLKPEHRRIVNALREAAPRPPKRQKDNGRKEYWLKVARIMDDSGSLDESEIGLKADAIRQRVRRNGLDSYV